MELAMIKEEWMHDLLELYSTDQLDDPIMEYGNRSYSFERLDVWNKSIDLVEWIYSLTFTFPGEEKFILTSQIRRASISVPSNIAEGVNRRTDTDKIHFINIAYNSLIELLNQRIIAKRLNFIQDEDYQPGRKMIQALTAMLFGLSRSFSK